MKLNLKDSAYLTCFWYEKLRFMSNPGMVVSTHLVCEHGLIKPDYFDCFPPKVMNLNETNSLESSICINYELNESECETKFALLFLKNQSVLVPKEIV